MQLYIIRQEDTHYYKIGRANNVKYRLRELQCGNPFNLHIKFQALYKPEMDLEGAMHWIFRNYRILGEWFIFTEEQVDLAIRQAENLIMTYKRKQRKTKEGFSWKEIYPKSADIENYTTRQWPANQEKPQ